MSDDRYREKCINQKGDYCHVCEATNDIRVHHIDGDRKNNDVENLIPLCRTCHAKVHTKTSQTPEIDELTEQLEDGSYLDTPSKDKQVAINIDSDVRDRLRGEKVGDETYSDVITRLIENDD
jgi:hypothetical protein